MSATSVVAFESTGSGSPNDTNDTSDVYVREIEGERTEMVSLTSDEKAGNGRSGWPSIAAGGGYVAFQSLASDLVEGDGNSTQDVFVRNREAGETERASVSADGADADGPSSQPSLSSNGRLVAFCSRATNLAAGDTNGVADVFVRDLDAGTTEHIVPPLVAGGEGCVRVAFAADALSVVFSYQTAPGEAAQVFRHNRESGETTQLTAGNAASGINSLAVSADGRFVVFESEATDLVADDTNGFSDVFLWEEGASITRLTSGADGRPANSNSGTMGAAISGDGRFVAFSSSASNLIPGDGNRSIDVFRLDRQSGQVTVASAGLNEKIGNAASYSPDVSDDGSAVAFVSASTNLIVSDRNRHADIFLRGTSFPENGGGEEAPPVDPDADPAAPVAESSGDGDDDRPPFVQIGLAATGLVILLIGGFLLLGRRGRA
jgi:Tol biopolymer transport system component